MLKQEVKHLGVNQLPLQQGLTASSYALGDNLEVMIISVSEQAHSIRAKVGIFYTGIIAGCSCADDPTPIDEQTEYCLVQLDIDKLTADTSAVLLAE